ncbi:NAD(P)-binding protein [Metschnikowia bicuspidata var. bicuspidata NRRL YB-4993]|uniref:NAD(P)-binding protein n=1 Tax=Metschnikowia bicuspidata var. bicuspidata NRRL YB-4993 TaxID=869754 RepID=A0A1A0H878_9ASCO|nr:NAD(P)-binding protein [Metschnikowia bicuspidata var. bicuspidata NRRL YB-4993]OBA20185.1 NAD(P)-binding protein [Metschnikowia bicuspidata var. bicuspidata NRRL YB-4993]
MSMKPRIKAFFGPSREYAVVGASNNPSKFGYKILSWYVSHGLPVVPVNPREPEILGQTVVPSVPEILRALSEKRNVAHHQLAAADGLSISFLTPPQITVRTLDDISAVPHYKSLVKGLWFQPGSYDQQVLDKTEELGLCAVHQDECILVRGDEGLYAANL